MLSRFNYVFLFLLLFFYFYFYTVYLKQINFYSLPKIKNNALFSFLLFYVEQCKVYNFLTFLFKNVIIVTQKLISSSILFFNILERLNKIMNNRYKTLSDKSLEKVGG